VALHSLFEVIFILLVEKNEGCVVLLAAVATSEKHSVVRADMFLEVLATVYLSCKCTSLVVGSEASVLDDSILRNDVPLADFDADRLCLLIKSLMSVSKP
jgi:hypothetical protein